MDVDVKNKVVVITGAGDGIGQATASRFAESGARLVVSDLDEHSARRGSTSSSTMPAS